MNKVFLAFLFGFFLLFIYSCSVIQQDQSKQTNVLFIAIDDLRPQLNCYGEKYMHTPHLDQLAETGRLFKNHFVHVPTCGASRYTLLLGQYPQYKKHLSNNVLRDHLAEAKENGFKTLPQVFKTNGYYTASLGKISHYVDGLIYTYAGKGDGRLEMPDSWNTVWGPSDKWGTAWNAFFGYADGTNRNSQNRQVAPTEFVAEKDNDLPDGLIAQKAVSELKALKNKNEPFFLAVGFLKPHLPFVAPKKYWDLYEGKKLPLSPNPEMPHHVSPVAIHDSGEMFNSYKRQPEKGGKGIRISDEYAYHLRQAYFAAVSYVDAQVGKVLQALKETGLDKNTIVIVWGDHGWHLGDHTVWGKHTLFERALKSTFIIKTPDLEKPGEASESIVETVDIYPTLLELCNLKAYHPLSGKSLVPVLKKPTASLDKPALGFWHSGYTMRSADYRFTRFKKGNQNYTELYDHRKDPDESQNLANLKENETLVKDLERKITQVIPKTFRESLQ